MSIWWLNLPLSFISLRFPPTHSLTNSPWQLMFWNKKPTNKLCGFSFQLKTTTSSSLRSKWIKFSLPPLLGTPKASASRNKARATRAKALEEIWISITLLQLMISSTLQTSDSYLAPSAFASTARCFEEEWTRKKKLLMDFWKALEGIARIAIPSFK